MSTKKTDNYWIPLADLMTVLMVIFLFISISYMLTVLEQQDEQNKLFTDFQKTKVELLKELQTEFRDDFRRDRWDAMIDTSDLSIKFINERVLFDYGKSELKPEFKSLLDSFFPRYLKIIMKPQYEDRIAEVRIEGHTDIQGDYIFNVQLSQDRTRNVLKYLLESTYYASLSDTDRERLRFWLTANGLSYGRTLDGDGVLTAVSHKTPDDLKCRRVEFKIVTTSDELIRKALRQMTR
jgi:outer membrane protein OmpA-like peptidoglycan-associated protein